MKRRDFLTLTAGVLGTPAFRAAAAPGAQGTTRSGQAAASQWKAGVATIDITPAPGIWMAGYAARKLASQGTAMPLHAKALALEDARGERAVLVTLDLLGVTAGMAERVAAVVSKRHRVTRARLLLNASHTHCGPVVDEMLSVAYELDDAQRALIASYTRDLEARVVRVIGDALAALRPARLTFGQSTAAFAANRRVQFTPDGPVDHAVPVLRVDVDAGSDADRAGASRTGASRAGATRGGADPSPAEAARAGEPLAVVFGYACHNTTLQAEITSFHGDYAGVAQAVLQRRHPSTTAMFLSGCGADSNPKPRGTLALVEQHGTALADAVDRVLPSLASSTASASAPAPTPASATSADAGASASASSPSPQTGVTLPGPLTAGYEVVDLPFAPIPSRETWTTRLQDDDQYVRRHARLMLDTLQRDGRLPTVQPDPVQVWRFGSALTLVTLGGEVVVDYALRLRKDYPDLRLWIAGYSNDVFGYVPSLRVLKEGGYEGGGAMLYYGRPGAFAPEVETLIHDAIRRLMREVTPP